MKYTIQNFRRDYPNDSVCLDVIRRAKYPEKKLYRVKGRKSYADTAGKHYYPLRGTIFEKSTTPLTIWFEAIYLFSISKNGISAMELQRHFGVTYKCAYRMGRQIRQLMHESDPLSGTIESDEGFFGGDKRIVVGAVERGGKARARVVPKKSALYTRDFIKLNVKKGSTIITDGALQYTRLKDFDHIQLNKARDGYQKSPYHTNTIEGFWNQVKRSISGTYHWVSPEYLQTYLDEFSWRHSFRYAPVPLFSLLLKRAC